MSDLLGASSVVWEVHELGPVVREDLLDRCSPREVAVMLAKHKPLLREYRMPGVVLYGLGARGQRLVGLTHRKRIMPGTVLDALALRLAIEFHVAAGSVFLGRVGHKRHLALLETPFGLECVAVKATDYSYEGVRDLLQRHEQGSHPGELVVMVRDRRFAVYLQRKFGGRLKVRPFADALVGVPDRVARLVTEVIS